MVNISVIIAFCVIEIEQQPSMTHMRDISTTNLHWTLMSALPKDFKGIELTRSGMFFSK